MTRRQGGRRSFHESRIPKVPRISPLSDNAANDEYGAKFPNLPSIESFHHTFDRTFKISKPKSRNQPSTITNIRMFPRSSLFTLMEAGTRLYPSPLGPSSAKLQRLDESSLVKIGYTPFIFREAEALRFVKASTSIPVPHVIDVWEGRDGEETSYLVLEFVEGKNLDVAWPQMTTAQQRNVAVQLRGYIDELRSLRQTSPGWIGSCSGGPAMDHRIQPSTGEDTLVFGPFSSVSTFHDFLLRRLRSRPGWQRHRSMYKDNHDVKFSHADFTPKNILVDPKLGKATAIIDWEMAGWWPAYWEYRKATWGMSGCNPVWRDLVPQIMDEYEEDAKTDQYLEYC